MTEASMDNGAIRTETTETTTVTTKGIFGRAASAIARHPFRTTGAVLGAAAAGGYAYFTLVTGGDAEDAVEAAETAAELVRGIFR